LTQWITPSSLAKLATVNVPTSLKLWVASFLSERSQCTKFNDQLSSVRNINKGIIQGSAIGPTLFSIMISDLQAVTADNDLFKFADDVTILAAEHSTADLSAEFAHISRWAIANRLPINLLKTKEVVFHRPRVICDIPLLLGIDRVTTACLLGITFTATLSFSPHIDYVLTQCSQRFYLLKSLKLQGLPCCKLKVVYNCIIVSRITYAISAWGGFISKADEDRVNNLLKRGFHYGYTNVLQQFQQLVQHADHTLFAAMNNKRHCLHALLPPAVSHHHETRPKAHSFQLPNCNTVLFKQSFLPRVLYNLL